MRVALVIRKLSGIHGGAERVVVELARALVDRGHSVTIVTYEADTRPPAYEAGPVPIVNVFPAVLRVVARAPAVSPQTVESSVSRRGNRGRMARAKWELTHGWFARRLAAWLRDHPHDTVIGFLPPAISAVALARERLGTDRPRIIASTHNVPVEDFGPSGRWDPNPEARRANLRALELADVVTVLQPDFVGQLPPAARRKAVVLPNAVRRLGAPSPSGRDELILGVGRLTDVKRFDLLVRAFARVAEELADWRLLIHGEGPERHHLERLVAELGLAGRVGLPGTTSDLGPVYDRARILGHPALFEGFGLSVAEAILHGVPVVASRRCPGVNDLVEDGATGCLVDDAADPVAAFAEAIRLLASRPLPAERQQAAVDRLSARLDPRAIYDAWDALLSD